MYIPFDNLYDFIAGLAPDTLIYRFDPPGSKKLQNLCQLNPNDDHLTWPGWMNQVPLICHDQEPLSFELNDLEWQQLRQVCLQCLGQYTFVTQNQTNEKFWQGLATRNLMAGIPHTLADRAVLLHSEQRSTEVEKFRDLAIPAYWWAHAVLALDWYRFAKWDPRIWQWPDYAYRFDFNVYARAWSGTREYRLYFLNQIVAGDLLSDCRITFDHHDQQHYSDYVFKNANFVASNLLDQINPTSISSSESGGYDVNHYGVCGIDVVTETLFDDTRWHLTEKILRPIACRKAFMLLATPGSLEYLRSYGFKTFHDIINEDYDQATDPKERIDRVVLEMQRISRLTQQQRRIFYQKLQSIADHNYQHFFSESFGQHIRNELKQNLTNAIAQVRDQYMCGSNWIKSRREMSRERRRALLLSLDPNMTTSDIANLLLLCRARQRRARTQEV